MDIKREKKPNRRRYLFIGGGILGLVIVTVALGQLKPAAPTVQRAASYLGRVERGPMVRDVRGNGRLVPENIRYISAVTGGRVERVLVRPGTNVSAGTVLLEMSNPDVELQALTAQQQLAAAQSQLVSLRTQLETGRLNQASTVNATRTQLREAQRQATSAESLVTRNLIAANEFQRVRDNVQELTERLRIEEARLDLMSSTIDSQLTLQREQVTRMREVANYNQVRVASMRVTAGVDGVLQDLTLQPGQWVQSGTALAQVVQPGRLKAELRVPETQARDIVIGQRAMVDTRLDGNRGVIPGRVIRTDPQSVNGTVTIEVGFDSVLPQGARPDLTVEGVIEIDRMSDVLYLNRPAYGQPGQTTSLFKLVDNGNYAERVQVRLGRASVNHFEILGGLEQGDSVILSDMTRWDNVDRVRLK